MTNKRTKISFITFIALTLAASASSVYAIEENADISSSASEVVVTSSSSVVSNTASLYQDTYRKDRLPNQAVFSDFVVGPGKFDLEIAPGESKTIEITVSNRMGDRRLVSLTTEDTAAAETGTGAVELLGDVRGPYTLKDYISIPHERFWLDHAHRARIPVTISIPADAEPGGFYGSIVTQIVSNATETSGEAIEAGGVIVSRIASLIFIKTPGEVDQSGTLSFFDTVNADHFFFSGPIDFQVTVENTGTVHLNPVAEINIANMVGETVGTVQMSPWFVFPGSVRTRDVSWDREFLFGRYTATLEIDLGMDEGVITRTITFWVLPWKYIVSIFVGLFVFFLIIRFFTTRFEFKRKT